MHDPKDKNLKRNGKPIESVNGVSDSSSQGMCSRDVLDREPIDAIAEEFAERHRRGERPTIDEYCHRHPELADEIRELFPAVITMERLRDRKRLTNGKKAPSPELPIENLGDFRVLSEIARGGMGIVFEAEQVTLGGRRVAVKVLPKHALRSERDIQRFQREAQTAAVLHHTNIVPVFGVGQQDGTHYIVMQLIRGVGLDEIITEVKRLVSSVHDDQFHAGESSRTSTIKKNARSLLSAELRRDSSLTSSVDAREFGSKPSVSLSSSTVNVSSASKNSDTDSTWWRKAADAGQSRKRTTATPIHSMLGATYYRNVASIGLQAASGLSYAHNHEILHRDIKPGNLLLDDQDVVWVADFGIAKLADEENVTGTGDVAGTLSYMAPERFQGRATPRSDIYSLGLTLYELLTLERAYDGSDRAEVMHRVSKEEIPSLRKLNPGIPRDLETIVLKAAARDPADRYESAEALACDLDCFLNDCPIKARRLGLVEQFSRWCKQNRAVASLAAAVSFLLVAVSMATAVGLVRETAQRQRAETTSHLALSALDKIYEQFTPEQLQSADASTQVDEDEDVGLTTGTQLPLSKDVAVLLESLLRFYDDLSYQSDDHAGVAVKSIKATRRVGNIQHRLGENDKAQVAYQRAIKRIEQLDPSVQQQDDVRLELAKSHNGLGIILMQRRMRENAAKSHARALATFAPNPELVSQKYELARTLYLLHLAELRPDRHRRSRQNKLPKQKNLQRAIAVLSELPTAADCQFLLAKCHLAESQFSFRRGSHEGQDKAIEILEGLVASFPQASDYQYELADVYVSMAWRRLWKRNDHEIKPESLADAEKRIARALEVTTDLDLNHPNIPMYQMLKARMHHVSARVFKEMGRLDEAERQFDKAIEKQSLVVRQSLDPVPHQVWQYNFELERAQLQRDANKLDVARQNLIDLAGRVEAVNLEPDVQCNVYLRRSTEKTLSRTCITLSDVLRKAGRKEDADQALRKAEKLD